VRSMMNTKFFIKKHTEITINCARLKKEAIAMRIQNIKTIQYSHSAECMFTELVSPCPQRIFCNTKELINIAIINIAFTNAF